MTKKLFNAVLLLSAIVFMTGCSVENKETIEDVSAVPSDAIYAIKGDEINLSAMTLSLPEGMSYGKRETDNGISYYVWKSGAEYVLPSSVDILFYVYEGNDYKSPDLELEDSQVRSSIDSYIQQGFSSEVEEARVVLDAGMTINNGWYTLCFTGYGGITNEVTTYGVYCYPKSYYGIYLLQKNVSENYTRNYYGFTFSNNGKGDIFTEEEYNFLFSQIKSGFGIEEFFTMPQLNYDETQDFSKGYNYEQLQELFKDTVNYYIITGNRAAENVQSVSLSPLYDVVRVVDGDTIIVSIEGEEVKVRLIGIDAPESVHPDETQNSEEGKDVSEWLTELLTDAKVYLEYDVSVEDEYGRTLAYVYLDDGTTMINRLLLQNGFAVTMTVQPNSKYADEFYDLQTEAREAGNGFWGTGFFQ